MIRVFLTWTAWLSMAASLVAQTVLPIEPSDRIETQNQMSLAGLPLSREAGNPPGSNGNAPSGNASTGVYAPPTAGQFRSMLAAGSVWGLTSNQWQAVKAAGVLSANTTAYNGAVAQQMGVGVGMDGSGAVVATLRRVAVGRVLAPRRPTHRFGQQINVPLLTETGAMLSASASTAYWLDKPVTTGADAFYWSPHARKVYASQVGPVFVTWMRATPFTAATLPAYTNLLGSQSFVTNGANIFLLFTQAYVVSATPAQTTRTLYWTQKDFMPTGKPVLVPPARVSGIRVAYSSTFPRTVTSEFKSDGSTSPTDGSTNAVLSELRTLWYEQQAGAIYAYNVEGRVLIELLGDSRNDGTFVQLGTEVVEVKQLPVVTDVTVELGERIVPPTATDVEVLYAEPVRAVTGDTFVYQDAVGTRNRIAYYATRETRNLNDLLIHWMEEGNSGILWPKQYSRYALVWPRDVSKYSVYVRPNAASFEEAQATSVALNAENAPVIEYQDPLDQPRARFTADLRFYTHLDAGQGAHRTLLRYTSNDQLAFERVLSVRIDELRANTLGSSPVAQSLSAWDGTNMVWPDALKAPRVVTQTVSVGDRITAPSGELGTSMGDSYVAGYINPEVGNLYNPEAYVDPFVSGFEAANVGAIIPVNVVPGKNALEVWWFRKSNSSAGMNAGNTAAGFTTTWWPSAVGRYTIAWPSSPRELVLASRLGGVDARVEEAGGVIYYQNNPALTGYNPNEEHAIMNAGIPYATRDDLNLTGSTAATYSSDAYVLVSYAALDGRPAMATYKVLREKASEGYVFDYAVPAGQIIQAPPPLGFLAAPVVGSGDAARSMNYEPATASQDLPVNWNAGMASGEFGHYNKFTYEDRHHDLWVYRGPHMGLPTLQAGRYNATSGGMDDLGTVYLVRNSGFTIPIHATRQSEFLALTVTSGPSWLTASGMTLRGTSPATAGTFTVQYTVTDRYEGSSVDGQFTLQVEESGSSSNIPGALSVLSTNPYTGSIVMFTNRAPFLALSPNPSNSFTVRYYYRTEPSFAWPGMANPPATASIVPYLRPRDASGSSIGDAASSSTASLDIVYRPYWPERDPKDASKSVGVLPYGATLAGSVNGLPAVRDFKTAHILYQQSIASDMSAQDPSVVLHDPTRAKYADIAEAFPETGEIPPSVPKQIYQGRYYFPTLPPHLQSRIYIDPNRGAKGSLVLVGEYRQEALGASYLLLNVLSPSDINATKDICPGADPDRGAWNDLVDALTTQIETFVENPQKPGTYIADDDQTEDVDLTALAEVKNPNIAVDSYAISAVGPGDGYVTLIEASGTAFTQKGDPVSMHIFRVGGSLSRGEVKVLAAANPLSELVTFQFSGDFAALDDEYEFEWKIAAPVNGQPPSTDATMSRYLTLRPVTQGLPRVTIGGAGIQALGDNYIVMRYRPVNPDHPLYAANPTDADWSSWTAPVLAEGWIKRVLAGINPFNQRLKDLFNNRVNSDVSLLTQAGKRWEGDVALNIDTINNYGLIEIYETVLRRGRMLSIESGFNYGPANDALLLAAGYLNDLYMLLGNEAWADAANPTIGIGTADKSYGDIATALFAFKGQVGSLLEEELGLLRGRDDFLMPGVDIAPVYNRLFWNYTRGIDSGEVIYALNYNIKEKAGTTADGVIDAADAAHMFPQGHGDAYGHYLTALKGYYSLLLNSNFDWVPRVEAVNVLGKAVTVDYQDERKFAAAAAALARSGRQIFDLTWRKDYLPVGENGWSHLAATRVNSDRTYLNQETGATEPTTRRWGADHWASRVGQGSYVNWLAANAVLPSVDPDPSHEGIQRVDRTTVPELDELVILATGVNTAMDNCEGGLSPLGITEGGLAFDLDPNAVVGGEDGTHFEQTYTRAKKALSNAVVAFDDAKDVTRLLRSETDSLSELQANIAKQEDAYTASLIELYGSPYPEDVGPGKLYKQGYAGPDLLHYAYVDLPEFDFPKMSDYTASTSFEIKILDADSEWMKSKYPDFNYISVSVGTEDNPQEETEDGRTRNGITFETDKDGNTNFVFSIDIGPHGFAEKPSTWVSRRKSPGKVQQAISRQILAHAKLREELHFLESDTGGLEDSISVFQALNASYNTIRDKQEILFKTGQALEKVIFANDLFQAVQDSIEEQVQEVAGSVTEGVPKSLIAGVAAGGDMTAPARGALKAVATTTVSVLDKVALARQATVMALELAQSTAEAVVQFKQIEPEERNAELLQTVNDLVGALTAVHARYWTINQRIRELDDARRGVESVVAEGDRIQAEREVFRRSMASVVQGFRTRDAAFRFFRNEKLERYKALTDLATRYALLAANAYDYETGLLGTTAGRQFVRSIVASRSLGVVRNGEPQFAGSSTGDPGLSSALASMKADWDVLKGRLGFNNPDAYGTTVSLRTENFRILPGTDGDTHWRDAMNEAYRADLLSDTDVRRYCLQMDDGSGLPVPGFVFTFSTEVARGKNLFGQPLASGDSYFSPASFATKIFASGVALEGYRGMATPSSNGGAVTAGGGTSPTDPNTWFLDPLGLAATPYVYLVPVGVDMMRSPPLGDQSNVRQWMVDDLAVPMPFNIGASEFATKKLWQSADSLGESLFEIRKHQPFRAVPSASTFTPSLYAGGGKLLRSQYTNNRLVGRSIWNTQWKLIIPAHALLANTDEGVDRFLQTIKDIKLHFVTYSYSGN
ncbi:MAG: hypothetical protein WCR07_08075 [Verrucomicrobiota bacterium]